MAKIERKKERKKVKAYVGIVREKNNIGII